METIEVSAIYKADQDGFHLDDKAKAIFGAHNGEWVDQGTFYAVKMHLGPMHLDRSMSPIGCQSSKWGQPRPRWSRRASA